MARSFADIKSEVNSIKAAKRDADALSLESENTQKRNSLHDLNINRPKQVCAASPTDALLPSDSYRLTADVSVVPRRTKVLESQGIMWLRIRH